MVFPDLTGEITDIGTRIEMAGGERSKSEVLSNSVLRSWKLRCDENAT